MVTPIGRYRVVKHLPSHLRIFLQLDYPNADDRARFEELKKKGDLPKNASIGGDIGIHGEPPEAKPFKKAEYQSHGCVVLEDAEIDQVARMVPDGTAVEMCGAAARSTGRLDGAAPSLKGERLSTGGGRGALAPSPASHERRQARTMGR
ncbi:L,D-transpeptidase family protein [Salmonella enterica]|uniref:Murein L,D-transpeptidase n=1 Tax=Salmonella enterica subsp. enterica serovar Dessau TaxID=2564349 RepID=A0A8E5IN36_SALET|nr:murein L,D-transpeptidase [Salmonella enterica subsp. enterica serovar Dessau]